MLELVHEESYEHYMARMAAIVREAKYQASLPPPVPNITISTDEQAFDLISECASGARGLDQMPDVLTLIGLYFEWKGHPGFAGFSKIARPLGPISEDYIRRCQKAADTA